MPLIWMFIKPYWKPLAIAVGAILLLAFFRVHYIHVGEANCEARHVLAEQKAAQELAREKEKHTADNNQAQAELTAVAKERDDALEAARKTPAVLTKIVTKVMHEGETCTDHDVGPDFERVWNDAAKAGSDKPVQ